jgi:hypothetical protein
LDDDGDDDWELDNVQGGCRGDYGYDSGISGGEDTGSVRRTQIPKYITNFYLCVVMKISKVSHTNFPIFFLQIVSGLMMERTSSLRAKKFGKGYF